LFLFFHSVRHYPASTAILNEHGSPFHFNGKVEELAMSMVPFPIKHEPLSVLGILAHQGAPLRMSRTYRGLLVTVDVNLLTIGADRVLFQDPRNRIYVRPGDQIVLHSPVSDETLGGRVLEINIQQCLISVGELTQIDRPWSERGQERVQAHQPVRVSLRDGNRGVPTLLENLSLTGVGLLAYKLTERGLELRPGQAVNLDFELPRGAGRFLLSARMANVGYPSSHLACLGVATYPDVEQAQQLERYITHRKAEILQEIDLSFAESFEAHTVTQLYF
jgi:hypothetical protein